jgi:hypothetical protein
MESISLFNRKMQWLRGESRWRWRGIYRALPRIQPLGSDSKSRQFSLYPSCPS